MVNLRENLRKKIQDEIAPWKSSNRKPPYTAEQLVAMALISTNTSLDVTKAEKWIKENFKYYSNKTTDYLYKQIIYSAMEPFHYPIDVEGSGRDERYTISVSNAELMLGHGIAGSNARSDTLFRFFDLPTELRQYIYELVFACPRSGVAPYVGTSPVGDFALILHAITRDYNKPFSFDEWENIEPELPSGGIPCNVPRLLSPLLVNRQFYSEAMPVFFAINNFFFPSLRGLEDFVIKTPRHRLKHIREISVVYEYADLREKAGLPARAFKSLHRVEGLQTLRLQIFERRFWVFSAHFGNMKVHESINNLPGLNALRSIKVDKVEFDRCPSIDPTLKIDMEKPPAQGAVKHYPATRSSTRLLGRTTQAGRMDEAAEATDEATEETSDVAPTTKSGGKKKKGKRGGKGKKKAKRS